MLIYLKILLSNGYYTYYPTTSTSKTYKVILVGDGDVGKTTFIKMLKNGEFESRYLATIYVNLFKISFKTTQGTINLQFWDTAGQEKFGGLRDGYYINAKAVIYMYDATNTDTYKSLTKWHKDVALVVENKVPSVIIGNKCDVLPTEPLKDYPGFLVSTKNNRGLKDPILHLLRQLAGSPNLEFI